MENKITNKEVKEIEAKVYKDLAKEREEEAKELEIK